MNRYGTGNLAKSGSNVPDPYQNRTGPEHCSLVPAKRRIKIPWLSKKEFSVRQVDHSRMKGCCDSSSVNRGVKHRVPYKLQTNLIEDFP
jgi:hypothetical protein